MFTQCYCVFFKIHTTNTNYFTVNPSFTILVIKARRILCEVRTECCINTRKLINHLTPNDHYSDRTAPLTSKVAFYIFIQQIQVMNNLNMVYTLRFFPSKCSLFHNSNIFGSCIIHILYIGCAKIKKIIPAPKG